MRVHNSQAYRKMDVTRERISRILELREILLSFQTGFNLVNAAVVCAIMESISDWELSKPQAEKIIAEEQAGFRAGRNTTEQILNPRILCEKYLQHQYQHQQDLYHVFIDFKKRCKLQWYGHVSRSSGLAKTISQGTVKEGRRQGRRRKRWEDNIRECTGLEFAKSQRAVDQLHLTCR